jgi:hypothetical protein
VFANVTASSSELTLGFENPAVSPGETGAVKLPAPVGGAARQEVVCPNGPQKKRAEKTIASVFITVPDRANDRRE